MLPASFRSRAALAAVAVLTAAPLAACSSEDDGGGGGGVRSRAALPSPCNLVSNRVLDDLDAAMDSAGVAGTTTADSVELVAGAEQMVGCVIVPGTLVAAVEGVEGDQDPSELVLDARTPAEQAEAGSPSPEAVDGIGDVGFVGRNSAGGYRIVASVGDRVVLVDSQAPADTDPLFPRELLIDLAQDLAERVEDLEVAPVDLPDPCPEPSSPVITRATGAVELARGSDAPTGVRCGYLGPEGSVDLQVGPTDAAAAAITDGPAADAATDLDGDPTFLDGAGHGRLYDADGCEVAVTVAPPPGTGEADAEEAVVEDDLVEGLLAAGRDDVGCTA